MAALKKSVLAYTSPGIFSLRNSTLKRVEYLGLDDFELQDRILRECLEELSKHHAEEEDRPPDERLGIGDEEFLRWGISRRSCLVKHSGFETEKEIRLIAPPHLFTGASLRFRFPRSTVIPYLEVLMPKRKHEEVRPVGRMLGLKDDSYFIDSVVVGPTPNPELTVKAVKLLFESKQVDDVAVLESDIPYRDL